MLIASMGFAAGQKNISGLVTDEEKSPLPGVSIVVKGTTTGTVTGVDGKFSMAIPATAKTLVFSFIGMKAQEVPVEGSNYTITLQSDVIGLEEVIAVGYGTMRKSDLTGSVVRVSMEDRPLQGNLHLVGRLQRRSGRRFHGHFEPALFEFGNQFSARGFQHESRNYQQTSGD